MLGFIPDCLLTLWCTGIVSLPMMTFVKSTNVGTCCSPLPLKSSLVMVATTYWHSLAR